MAMRVALFDFDGTLTRRDTLLPFLSRVRGPVRLALDLCLVSPWLVGYASRLMTNTFAKEALLRQCLGGMTMVQLQPVAASFARDDIPRLLRPDTMDKLRRHQDKGDLCVLVSASLSLYLEPWGRSAGFNHILSTQLECLPEIGVTGHLQGGNCHGQEKVNRIKKLLDGLDISHVTAYGDSAGDREMIDYADQGHWL